MFVGFSTATSGGRLIPCLCKQQCSDERVGRGIVACGAHRQSSSGGSVSAGKRPMIASFSIVSTVERGSSGPVGRSWTEDRPRRRGAPVENLTHSESFHSEETIATSKSRIKQPCDSRLMALYRSHSSSICRPRRFEPDNDDVLDTPGAPYSSPKRYPIPDSVRINRGEAGSVSSLARSWPTKTRRYCVSSLCAGPQIAVRI
jgi:hypothetical protein